MKKAIGIFALLLALCLAGCDIQISGLPTVGGSENSVTTQPLTTSGTEAGATACSHKYTETVIPAGCTTIGLRELHCTLCGDIQKEELPVTGHSYEDWRLELAATCTEEGLQMRTCKLCGMQEKNPIPAAGHIFGEETVLAPGSCTEPRQISHSCTACKLTEETTVPAPGHSFQEEIITTATCTRDGEIHAVCTACKHTEVKIQSATGHQFGAFQVLSEPTCTVPGQRAAVCTVCQESAFEEIPSKGHKYGSYKVTLSATCTQPGRQEKTCAACGDGITEAIPAKGHAFTEQEIVKATCTTAGELMRGCDICGHKESAVIPAKGHRYGGYTIITAATCTEPGQQAKTCSACGDEITEVIPAKGHNYNDGVLVKAAVSCAEPGLRRYTCSACGESYDKTISGPHTLGEPYHYRANKYRDCIHCGFRIHDLYTEWEPAYSDCDPKAALNTDTIKLKYTEYNGPLATWPEQWHKYAEFFIGVIQDRGHELPADVEFYIYDLEFPSYEWLLEDLLACRQSFYEVYGWMPAEPYIEVWEDGEKCVVLDAEAHYQSFRKSRYSLSSARKEQIVNDLVAWHVLSSGVWDGMQAYNAIAHLHDRLVYKMVRYDHNYVLRTSYDALAGGSCVCEGYADIMNKMLEFCGIKCEKVVGTMVGEGHAWNRVIFSDGTERYVDATNFSYRMLVLVPDYVLKYDDEYKW